jgi:hypothetical protein
MIRKATAADFPDVFRLFYEAWEENPGMDWPAPEPVCVAQMVEASLLSPQVIILIHACEDGSVDGILYGYVQQFVWAKELQAVLVLLRVSEDASSSVADGLTEGFHAIVDPLGVREVSFTMSSGIEEGLFVRRMRKHGYVRIGVDLRRKV